MKRKNKQEYKKKKKEEKTKFTRCQQLTRWRMHLLLLYFLKALKAEIGLLFVPYVVTAICTLDF